MTQGQWARKGHKVTQVQRAHKVHRARKVVQAKRARKVRQVQLASPVTGATGPQGQAGVGLVSGAYLTLASTAPAPDGFTLLGTTTIKYRDGHNVVHDSTLKLYQKD